jgi:hypothetical protein
VGFLLNQNCFQKIILQVIEIIPEKEKWQQKEKKKNSPTANELQSTV